MDKALTVPSVYAPGQVQLLHLAQFPEADGCLDEGPGRQPLVANLLAAAAACAQEFQHAFFAGACLGIGCARRLRFRGSTVWTQGLRMVAGMPRAAWCGNDALACALRLQRMYLCIYL